VTAERDHLPALPADANGDGTAEILEYGTARPGGDICVRHGSLKVVIVVGTYAVGWDRNRDGRDANHSHAIVPGSAGKPLWCIPPLGGYFSDTSAAIADLNREGLPEVVVATGTMVGTRTDNGVVAVYDDAGHERARRQLPASTCGMAVADVLGDRELEIAVGSSDGTVMELKPSLGVAAQWGSANEAVAVRAAAAEDARGGLQSPRVGIPDFWPEYAWRSLGLGYTPPDLRRADTGVALLEGSSGHAGRVVTHQPQSPRASFLAFDVVPYHACLRAEPHVVYDAQPVAACAWDAQSVPGRSAPGLHPRRGPEVRHLLRAHRWRRHCGRGRGIGTQGRGTGPGVGPQRHAVAVRAR
jgi:hypothetical protein